MQTLGGRSELLFIDQHYVSMMAQVLYCSQDTKFDEQATSLVLSCVINCLILIQVASHPEIDTVKTTY